MRKIEIKNVSKIYGNTRALDNVSLTFEEGVIYGLLGRNGAGKSTLLGCITNRIFPDSGEIFLDEEPVMENDSALKFMYMMSEDNLYPKDFKIKDVFRWSNEFYGCFDLDRANRYSEAFGLDTNKKVSKLSTGYTSIYKVITALSLNLPFIIFDEPVLGLDANHRDLFYKLLIESYSENPKAIIFSTHLIEEIAGLMENVIIMKSGRIIEDTSTQTLLNSYCIVKGTACLVDKELQGKDVTGTESLAGLKTAYVKGTAPAKVPSGLEISKPDLQNLFIQITKGE